MNSGTREPDNYDPWDGDAPVFDPKCEKCGRFHKRSEIRMTVNGAGEILSATSVCPRCGVIPVHVTHWRSDVEYARG